MKMVAKYEEIKNHTSRSLVLMFCPPTRPRQHLRDLGTFKQQRSSSLLETQCYKIKNYVGRMHGQSNISFNASI